MKINAIQQASWVIRDYERDVETPTKMEAELANALIRLRLECLEVFGVLAMAMFDAEIGADVREIAQKYQLGKRYEVRQDRLGQWGILDKPAVLVQNEFGIPDGGFAPWGYEEGKHDAHQFREILGWAVALNQGTTNRETFAWETWEPKL